jgi:hypothetical protein
MTEEKWLACVQPRQMLEHLGLSVSDRKLRLFAAACCRRNADQLTHEKLRLSVETGELFADGLVSQKKRGAVHAATKEAGLSARTSPPCYAFAASLCSVKNIRLWIHTIWYQSGKWSRDHEAERAALLREIIGNPFRPVTFNSAWLSSTVTTLAEAAYEERDLPSGELDRDRLVILADALEDAGCTDADILEHLRAPGPHVRGCWTLDLILGKE